MVVCKPLPSCHFSTILSDAAGAYKLSTDFFEKFSDQANDFIPIRPLMIGEIAWNRKDIQGGNNAGIDSIWL